MALIDITNLEAEAQKEISDELARKAKDAIKRKLRDLEAARAVVRNVEREIDDLKASIADGSFVS